MIACTNGLVPTTNYTFNFAEKAHVLRNVLLPFLSLESITSSAPVSRVFQQIMSDKACWKGIAKELNITPLSDDTVQADVIGRLKANAYAAKHFPFESQLTSELRSCKDLVKLNHLVKSSLPSIKNGGLILEFHSLMSEYDRSIGTKNRDKSPLEAAWLILQEGGMSDANKNNWTSVIIGACGFEVGEGNKYIHIPEHFKIFKMAIEEIMKSEILTPEEKQSLIDRGMPNSATLVHMPPEGNYPYNYMEVLTQAGWNPGPYWPKNVFSLCPLDFSGSKDPMIHLKKYATLVFKRATPLEREELLKEHVSRHIIPSSLVYVTDSLRISNYNPLEWDISRASEKVCNYIHSLEMRALILGEELDPIMLSSDISAKRKEVLAAIEKAEKNAFENLEGDAEQKLQESILIKEFYSRIRKVANL